MIEWYYLVIISAVLMALATIVEKKALKVEHATQFSAAFSMIIAVVSLVFVPWASFQISAFQWLLLLVGSLISAAVYLIQARVFKHGSISNATPASGALPVVFVIFLAYIFLSERLNAVQYLSLAGIVVGTYLILFKKMSKDAHDFDSNKYRYMIIANGVLSAIGMIIGKYQLVNIDVLSYLILTQILMAIEFAIFITIKYNGLKEIQNTIKTYRNPLIATVFLTLAYRLTFFYALSSPFALISAASPLRNAVFVIITVLVGGMMFKEEGLLQKIAISIALLIFSFILIA